MGIYGGSRKEPGTGQDGCYGAKDRTGEKGNGQSKNSVYQNIEQTISSGKKNAEKQVFYPIF
jgi:hypothetical protein